MWYACLLAGGRSSRMGQDKADLQLAGHSLLQRASDLLHSAGAAEVLISGRPALPGGIPDLLPHCGPPGGLYSALDHINKQHGLDGSPLLLIPVDMPLLTQTTLKAVLEGCSGATACHYAGEVFPCVLRASPKLLAHLHELFSEDTRLGGKRSMKGIFEWLHGNVLPRDTVPEQEFLNVNTPADWENILAIVSKDASP